MKLLSVVGARPQFIKVAPVNRAAYERGHDHVIVHTGQHYDANMSDVFFDELSIPEPDINLGVGSGSHGHQTAAMLSALEDALIHYQPDLVIVYGDTNSTIAAALAAAKQHFPIAHVEAGLRSFNRLMPEEHNRVLTDHCADLLLAPTESAMRNLAREGLSGRAYLVGDVMLDVFDAVRRDLDSYRRLIDFIDDGAPYVLATIHRQENTDNLDRLTEIIGALAALPLKVALTAHPRLRNCAERADLSLEVGAIVPFPPLAYRELVAALLSANAVVTDSGGLQKEAFFAGIPCTTVRPETEWVETLVGDWNVLVEPKEIGLSVLRAKPSCDRGTPYGSGRAGDSVIQAIEVGMHAEIQDW